MEFSLNIHQSEQDFIQACVRHEEWAQRKLYEETYPVMFAMCMRYASDRDEALDILHDGFIKVFRYIGKYEIGTSLTSWMRRIMINTAIDHYRKKDRLRTEDIHSAYNLRSVDPDVISELSAKEIVSALQFLTPAYRTVFNLYVIEGFSHKEIAHKMKISESTSRSNLVKARNKLKSILAGKLMISHER